MCVLRFAWRWLSVVLVLVSAGCLNTERKPTSLSEFTVPLVPGEGWGLHAWEDSDGVKRDTSVAFRKGTEEGVAAIDYAFGSAKATQVHVDLPLCVPEVFTDVTFEVMGDGSGNQLQLFLNGLAGKWYGQGCNMALGSTAWIPVRCTVAGTPTDVVWSARFIIVQKTGASKGTVSIRNLAFKGIAADSAVSLGHVFGEVPTELPWLAQAKPFNFERKRVDERAIILMDGDPLFCVLDANLTPDFLSSARAAGVNTLSIDLYWRDLEPREGYADWDRLEAQIQAYGRCGFALIYLVNIHQPAWVLRQAPEEPPVPGAGCIYPNAPVVRANFARFLKEFIKHTAKYPNVLAYGLSAGGEADADFSEVNGDVHPWRKSPACLKDFRAFLKAKYATDKALRSAWDMTDVSMGTAVPVAPLGPYNQTWRDTRTAAHDWREFVDRHWMNATEWQARIVRKEAPGKRTLVRLSWPVFQTFNPFLARGAGEWLDMLQDKDAVPSWEQATPLYLRSRAAMFQAAVRGTDIVNFPEVDVGHNRGAATPEDIARFVPAVADFAGGVWYYRNVTAGQWRGITEAAGKVKPLITTPRPAKDRRAAIFYGERYANWVQNHSEYDNEDSIAGTVRALDSLGVPFDIVSEDGLGDLEGYKVLIVPSDSYMPRDASVALDVFVQNGGRILADADAARFDIQGQTLAPAWKARATVLPAGALLALRPKEDTIVLRELGRVTIGQIKEFLTAAGIPVTGN